METDGDIVFDTAKTDWEKLFFISGMHHILPMIYHSIKKKQLLPFMKPELAVVWKKLAIRATVDQIIRTEEFLTIYERLRKAGVKALVVKGIVLRMLYPNHNERISGDEDIYIRREDFSIVASVLTSSGFILSESNKKSKNTDQETIYVSTRTELIIEVHTDLFDPAIGLYKAMNNKFERAFENSIMICIGGISIYTLSYSDHLLFLILHCAKHFICMGVGIRQVCDLVLFCNTYGKEIDYPRVWQQVIELGYQTFFLNLLAIGKEYLGLSDQMVWYPPTTELTDVHSDALLEDIMRAGIYGKSTEERTRTCSLTLQAVIADRGYGGRNRDRNSLLRIIFPNREFMKNKYLYCRNKPFLLPLAWLHRMATNMLLIKNPVKMIHNTNRSIAMGRKRIELLKEYKIIGIQDLTSEIKAVKIT
jgi:hypothetical protein